MNKIKDSTAYKEFVYERCEEIVSSSLECTEYTKEIAKSTELLKSLLPPEHFEIYWNQIITITKREACKEALIYNDKHLEDTKKKHYKTYRTKYRTHFQNCS